MCSSQTCPDAVSSDLNLFELDQLSNTIRVQWVDMNGNPQENLEGMTARPFNLDLVLDMSKGSVTPDLRDLSFRDPNAFVAGQLHAHTNCWERIVEFAPYDEAYEVLDWIKNKVSLHKYFRHFKGSFQSQTYDSPLPPPKIFKNNSSCHGFEEFIDKTILQRVKNGALSVWGRVGEVDPPHLVMPLTVEPTKPRLCNDNRYLNLWMVDKPFVLDNLSHLPRYLHKDCFQTLLDDKSGYDHIFLDEKSRTFFGIEWKGWFFVSNVIPFGWKLSAFIYHSTSLVAAHFFRSIGVPCSVYIDDRHFGQLQQSSSSYEPVPNASEKGRFQSAQTALFIAAYTLLHLGYTLGLSKCSLIPQKRIKFLGFISDTTIEAFYLPEDKKTKFRALAASILSRNHVSLVSLQRLAGKCLSFALAIQDSRLFTNEINMAIGKASRSSKAIRIHAALKEEIEHWLQPHILNRVGKWRDERHTQFVLFSDASSFAWGSYFPEESLISSDYWPPSCENLDITTKETKALTNTVRAFQDKVRDGRVDAYVDNKSLALAWHSQAARSHDFSLALKELFSTVVQFNIHLTIHHLPSEENPADQPSRRLSRADCKLSPRLWSRLQSSPDFGGPLGHSCDLMALDSNAQTDLKGFPLPHFTPYPTPQSAGVDVFAQNLSPTLGRNPYVFPPILLIGQVVRLLQHDQVPCTLVVPDIRPRRYWWAFLSRPRVPKLKLATRGEVGAILTPTKKGFSSTFPLPWDLWAFRL